MNFIKFSKRYSLRTAALAIIAAYQRLLSPDHSWLSVRYPYGFCRFYPSCSEYAKLSIEKKGVMSGSIAAAGRLIRCNPWVKGGKDLPVV